MEKETKLYKQTKCHPEILEAQAEDLLGYVCEKCGALLLDPEKQRKVINTLIDKVNR